MKRVMTISGIRPDFIRMSHVFKELDERCDHVLVHTGQHYDRLLSDVFFDELDIREPDHNLGIGGKGNRHYHQLADLSVKIIELIESEKIDPDLIVFLGDSNSVGSAFPLKKEGYRIGHIEAGMRSYDRRMLEEINRTVCDHCSDILFVYHEDYRQQALREGISDDSIHVVGNTIVEVCNELKDSLFKVEKRRDIILMDIHRPENFLHPDRMQEIMNAANHLGSIYNVPVKMLSFSRTMQVISENKIDIGDIEPIDLMPYKEFLAGQYHSLFLISDSGTAQEEAALLDTPVIVPRDFTERPQSVAAGNSAMWYVGEDMDSDRNMEVWAWLDWALTSRPQMDTGWLGDGNTAKRIVDIIEEQC